MTTNNHYYALGVLWLTSIAACGPAPDDNPFESGMGGPVTTGAAPGSASDGGGGEPTGASDGAATGAGDGAADDTGGGIKLDVGSPETGGPCAGDGCSDGCTSVDLVFVIDNSVSMGGYQAALGLAFPAFAETLDQTLPMGTSLHVGVTSTEMEFSSTGSTSISNGMCSFVGENGMTNEAYYVTPDVVDTGRNGAQGRLYDPGDGTTYFDYQIGTGGADLEALESWFAAAANIGTGGSNIEMSTGPAGWVADPANDATNAGFIRDQGSVLVVFFMQDEPDQTPAMIDGQPGGLAMLDKLVQAKAGCGGTDCIVAGGFLNEQACSATGNLPLDDLLANVGETPVVEALPNEGLAEGDPQAAAEEMNMALSGTLAEVIAQTCEQIPPAG